MDSEEAKNETEAGEKNGGSSQKGWIKGGSVTAFCYLREEL